MANMNPVLNTISHIASRNKIILTFLSDEYFPIFALWYATFKQFHKTNFVVLALDHPCLQKLLRHGVTAIPFLTDEVLTSRNRRILWLSRVELFHGLINEGIDFIHTDADAFWLSDIEPYFDSVRADISISIAYGIPTEAVRAWGFTCCCGLFQMRSSARTRRFMDDYLEKCKGIRHDQQALNMLFLEKGIMWTDESIHRNHGYIGCYGITVDVISDEIVSRKPKLSLAVFHPYLPSTRVRGKLYQAVRQLRVWKQHEIGLMEYCLVLVAGMCALFCEEIERGVRHVLKGR